MHPTKVVNDTEFAAIVALAPAKRYAHFVKQVADWGQVWSLRSRAGWVLAQDDAGHEVVPVWPHARYAAACASGAWQDSTPAAIALDEWLDAWLPGIARDNRHVAVFPTSTAQGVSVTSERLQADVDAELRHYE